MRSSCQAILGLRFGEEDPDDEKKPADWLALFGGNTDDDFRIGISLTKSAIKLFVPPTCAIHSISKQLRSVEAARQQILVNKRDTDRVLWCRNSYVEP